MDRKYSLSIVASLLISGSVFANTQQVDIQSGWNLIGSQLDSVQTSSFSNVKAVWGWDETQQKWKAYSANTDIEGKIKQLEDTGRFSTFNLNKGDGFWVSSAKNATLTLDGTSSDVKSKLLSRGWNLVSFSGSQRDIESVLKSNGQIQLVWGYIDGEWKAWSPSTYITNLIEQKLGKDKVLKTIEPNRGYWISSQMATNIGIDITPPTVHNIVLVYQPTATGPVGVANANLMVDDKVIGKTNSAGEFDFTKLGLADGTTVKVVKDGFTTTTGVIKNGALTVAILPIVDGKSVDKDPRIARSLKKQASVTIKGASEGNEIPLPTIITMSLDGGSMELSGSSSTGSVTVFTTMYDFPTQAPAIVNNIKVGDDTVLPKELSVIGGANITLKDVDGNTITDPSKLDNTGLSFNLLLDRYIGDFGKILQGLTGKTINNAVNFDENAIKLLKKARDKGLIDFYLLLQKADGTWKYLDDAVLVKSYNGLVIKPKNIDKVSEFGAGNIAYVIRTKAVEGTTKVCLTYRGERMFDGTILGDEHTGKPVVGASIVPDEHVLSQPAPTNEKGCTFVDYKVPFLAPMYHVTAVKSGMYNEPITVNVEFGNLDKDHNETTLAKPSDISIKGYVKSTFNNKVEPEDDAIVTLRDPQILVPTKIKVNSQEDNNSIQLLAAPNLTYTWVLSKDDSDKNVTIKSGNAEDGNNILKEEDIEDIIYNTDPSKNPWLENPYGHYYINVTVKHDYDPAQSKLATFTEAMTLEFDAQVDEPALIRAFSYTVNQGNAPVYKTDENGTTTIVSDINASDPDHITSEELKKARVSVVSIFGGKDLSWEEGGYLPVSKPYAYPADEFKWINDVVSLEHNDSDMCIDMSDEEDARNPYMKKLVDMYGTQGYCVGRVLPKTYFNKQFLPFSQVYSMFINNFEGITKNDPGNGKPFYQSGFTVLNTYYAMWDRKTVNKNIYTTYVPAYTSLGEDKFTKVSDFSNVINFSAKANQAIAFDTVVTKTEKDGSYRIDHVPPAIVGSLELMARAEGTKYNTKNFRNVAFPDAVYSGDLENNVSGASDTYTEYNGQTKYTSQAGDVLVHNFMLDRLPPKELNMGFENNLTDNMGNTWTVEKLAISNAYINTAISDDVKWQVVSNDDLPTLNQNYLDNVWAGASEQPTTILKTLYGTKYAWMGSMSTGTYAENGEFVWSGKQVATALKSPVIDFSDFSLATLKLKTWFETSAIDAAWDTAFIGFEIVDENTTGSDVTLIYYNGFSWQVHINQMYIHRLTPTAPIASTYNNVKAFSNNGLNATPSWMDYSIPLDFLAGHKARIVFGFFTADNLYNNFRGWGVDDITLKDNVEYVIQTPPMPEEFEEAQTALTETNTSVENNTTNADVNSTLVESVPSVPVI